MIFCFCVADRMEEIKKNIYIYILLLQEAFPWKYSGNFLPKCVWTPLQWSPCYSNLSLWEPFDSFFKCLQVKIWISLASCFRTALLGAIPMYKKMLGRKSGTVIIFPPRIFVNKQCRLMTINMLPYNSEADKKCYLFIMHTWLLGWMWGGWQCLFQHFTERSQNVPIYAFSLTLWMKVFKSKGPLVHGVTLNMI